MKLTHSHLTLALLVLVSCGGGGEEGAVSANTSSGRAPVEVVVERESHPEVLALRTALDRGDVLAAEPVLKSWAARLGAEGDLLFARFSALEGKQLDVTQYVEGARLVAPTDPRVYATAAELHAAAGRLETARDEIRRGVEACGLSPELLRAQGWIQLCTPNGAQRGLELLQRALSYDAELPFTARALGQAHLLLGKQALAGRRPKAALEHVRHSLESDPEDLDAQLFFADTLAAAGEFPDAVRVLEELQREGYGREAELALMYKRAAMAELLLKRRDQALEYFRLAREAGLSDEELGSGTEVLQAAALEAVEAGQKALRAGELETARLRFEHALRYDSEYLIARHSLALVLFQERQYLPAATHWRQVLTQAAEENLVLPDPIHIFLAKALYAADEKLAARAVLTEYIERKPDGGWVEQTRDLLSELP